MYNIGYNEAMYNDSGSHLVTVYTPCSFNVGLKRDSVDTPCSFGIGVEKSLFSDVSANVGIVVKRETASGYSLGVSRVTTTPFSFYAGVMRGALSCVSVEIGSLKEKVSSSEYNIGVGRAVSCPSLFSIGLDSDIIHSPLSFDAGVFRVKDSPSAYNIGLHREDADAPCRFDVGLIRDKYSSTMIDVGSFKKEYSFSRCDIGLKRQEITLTDYNILVIVINEMTKLEFDLSGYSTGDRMTIINNIVGGRFYLSATGGDTVWKINLYVYNVQDNSYEKHYDGEDNVRNVNIELALSDFSPYISAENKMFFVLESQRTSLIPDSDVEFGTCELVTEASFIKAPTLSFSGINMLKNPSFEMNLEGWGNSENAWDIDLVQYYEGFACASTFYNNKPLQQEVLFPGGEYATILGVINGNADVPNGLLVEIEFLDSQRVAIDSFSKTYDVFMEHTEFWFSTPFQAPAETMYARLSFVKQGGITTPDEQIYLDQVMLCLGSFNTKPTWVNASPKILSYDGDIGKEDVLRIDLGSRSVDVNGFYSQYQRVKGDFFAFPVGKTIINVTDGDDSSHAGEVILRYDELWS